MKATLGNIGYIIKTITGPWKVYNYLNFQNKIMAFLIE